MSDDEPPITLQIKISRANSAGVPAEKIAAYFKIPLAQVEQTIALDRRFRAEEAEFAAWIAANVEPKP
jgi:hypothetical protein